MWFSLMFGCRSGLRYNNLIFKARCNVIVKQTWQFVKATVNKCIYITCKHSILVSVSYFNWKNRLGLGTGVTIHKLAV